MRKLFIFRMNFSDLLKLIGIIIILIVLFNIYKDDIKHYLS